MFSRVICGVLLVCGLAAAQETLEHAWQLAAGGNQAEAIELLSSLVKKQPANADVRLLLGSLLMEANQANASLEQLREAVRLRPSSFEAQNALGEALSKFGDQRGARDAFEKAVALKPDYGIAQLNLGQVLLTLGKPAEAVKHLDPAIHLLGRADEGADARYLRAKVYAAQSGSEEAVKLLEQAVAIRPKFAEAWSDLGQARKTLLDNEGALSAFQRAVEANPQGAIAQYRLGSQYLQEGDAAKAVDCLTKARQLNPTDQSTLNALQMALRQDGKIEEAARIKQELAELLREKDTTNQNHLTAIRLNNEGAELEKAGDLRGALRLYGQAASLYPDHAGIHTNYGVALLRTGQWTAGLQELHDALKRDPKNATLRATLDDALAHAPPESVPKWQDAP
jgi:tetratricopeptide (TPR) repeat protein